MCMGYESLDDVLRFLLLVRILKVSYTFFLLNPKHYYITIKIETKCIVTHTYIDTHV